MSTAELPALPFATSCEQARLTPHARRVLWRHGVALDERAPVQARDAARARCALRDEARAITYIYRMRPSRGSKACVQSARAHAGVDKLAAQRRDRVRALLAHAYQCSNVVCSSACMRARYILSDYAACSSSRESHACYVCTMFKHARRQVDDERKKAEAAAAEAAVEAAAEEAEAAAESESAPLRP